MMVNLLPAFSIAIAVVMCLTSPAHALAVCDADGVCCDNGVCYKAVDEEIKFWEAMIECNTDIFPGTGTLAFPSDQTALDAMEAAIAALEAVVDKPPDEYIVNGMKVKDDLYFRMVHDISSDGNTIATGAILPLNLWPENTHASVDNEQKCITLKETKDGLNEVKLSSGGDCYDKKYDGYICQNVQETECKNGANIPNPDRDGCAPYTTRTVCLNALEGLRTFDEARQACSDNGLALPSILTDAEYAEFQAQLITLDVTDDIPLDLTIDPSYMDLNYRWGYMEYAFRPIYDTDSKAVADGDYDLNAMEGQEINLILKSDGKLKFKVSTTLFDVTVCESTGAALCSGLDGLLSRTDVTSAHDVGTGTVTVTCKSGTFPDSTTSKTITCACDVVSAVESLDQCIDPGDPCVPNDCQNGGVCNGDGNSGYTCACLTGFSGEFCEIDDPCNPNDCQNGGTCTDIDGNVYTCSCPVGYIGDHCEIDDPCVPNDCQNGGTCYDDGIGGHRCTCPTDFIGDNCEEDDACIPDNCQNGGVCSNDGIGGYTCSCPTGFFGINCESDDPCVINYCENGGMCKDDDSGGYTCECQLGFSGTHCEIDDPCVPNNCQNGGVCSNDGSGSYTCSCPTGFFGNNCENDDPCVPNNCQNGGVCSNDGSGSYTCSCPTGFFGNNCENDDPCVPNSCQNGGVCSNDGSGSYACSCSAGFFGNNCESDNQCPPNTCQNGGVCNDDGMGGYSCSCQPGFVGDNCEHDLCNPNPCNGVACVPEPGSYSCSNCPVGLTGADCLTDVDECSVNNGGCEDQCVNEYGSFHCYCGSGFKLSGEKNCIDINECTSPDYVCPANSDCIDRHGSYRCVCSTGFVETVINNQLRCMEDIDQCSSCPSNSVCINMGGELGFSCHCSLGYGYDVHSDGSWSCEAIGEANVRPIVREEIEPLRRVAYGALGTAVLGLVTSASVLLCCGLCGNPMFPRQQPAGQTHVSVQQPTPVKRRPFFRRPIRRLTFPYYSNKVIFPNYP